MSLKRSMLAAIAALFCTLFGNGAHAACANIAEGKCTVELQNGMRLAYLDTGPTDGRTIFLLHGLTDSVLTWVSTADALRKIDPKLRVISLDQRGHGASAMPAQKSCPTDPKSCFTPKLFAEDLVQLMDTLGIQKAFVAGHSMGSVIAQEAALDYPDRIEGTILVSTTGKGQGNPVLQDYVLKEPVNGSWKTALAAKGITTPEAIWNAKPTDADPNAKEWLAKFWDVDAFADQALVAEIVEATSNVRIGTWIGATEGLLDSDNLSRLASMSRPTLVLWATQDTIFLKEPDQVQLQNALKQASQKLGTNVIWKEYGKAPLPASGVPSDIGHNIPWETPNEVAQDIVSFLDTGKPTSTSTSITQNGAAYKIVTE